MTRILNLLFVSTTLVILSVHEAIGFTVLEGFYCGRDNCYDGKWVEMIMVIRPMPICVLRLTRLSEIVTLYIDHAY